ncbi:4-hydroxy-3-methylbut-2-enyl diphosphate reductase, partial [bacterium]|nr:4-hydroxy-3-methylbut-2-enyl diphosphate reductase [bacterium]
DLAKISDLVVVVGSKKSANTTHLAEILREITKTIHIETDKELSIYHDIIENAESITITAGASTPDEIIQKVYEKLSAY